MRTVDEILQEIDRMAGECVEAMQGESSQIQNNLRESTLQTLHILKQFITAPSEKCEHNFKPICAHCGYEFGSECEHDLTPQTGYSKIGEAIGLYSCNKCGDIFEGSR